MQEVKINDFENLLSSIEAVNKEIAGRKEKEHKKETYERRAQFGTLCIAVISLIGSIYSIIHTVSKDRTNNEYQRETDKNNAAFQRESQAYTFWLSYLQLAEQNPEMANGIKEINGWPIRYLADREWINKPFKNADIQQFEKYAWFVANTLAYAERVADLTKGDEAWAKTIKTVLHTHAEYLGSRAFIEHDLQDYSGLLQKEIGLDTVTNRDTLKME